MAVYGALLVGMLIGLINGLIITVVVVAGRLFTGGHGSLIATGVASVFMTQLGQMVLSIGATAATQLFAQAVAIVLATRLRTAQLGSVFHWTLARA